MNAYVMTREKKRNKSSSGAVNLWILKVRMIVDPSCSRDKRHDFKAIHTRDEQGNHPENKSMRLCRIIIQRALALVRQPKTAALQFGTALRAFYIIAFRHRITLIQ